MRHLISTFSRQDCSMSPVYFGSSTYYFSVPIHLVPKYITYLSSSVPSKSRDVIQSPTVHHPRLATILLATRVEQSRGGFGDTSQSAHLRAEQVT